LHERIVTEFDRDQTFPAFDIWMRKRRSAKKFPHTPLLPPHAEREADVNSCARTIIELNIRHYRALLQSEMDRLKRQTILQLLAEEEAKLARLPSNKEN
jgi:hypothetical protein